MDNKVFCLEYIRLHFMTFSVPWWGWERSWLSFWHLRVGETASVWPDGWGRGSWPQGADRTSSNSIWNQIESFSKIVHRKNLLWRSSTTERLDHFDPKNCRAAENLNRYYYEHVYVQYYFNWIHGSYFTLGHCFHNWSLTPHLSTIQAADSTYVMQGLDSWVTKSKNNVQIYDPRRYSN